MSYSITIHQNMGSHAAWDNPNVWVGDANGNPVTPQKGVECHLWSAVQNNGTELATNVVVSFFLCIPSGAVLFPESAHGSNSIPSLNASATARIMCSVPWIPDTSQSTHQCIVAVVSCMDCPAPPTTPGTPVDDNNSQIGQKNVTIQNKQAAAQKAMPEDRTFNVVNARNDGYINLVRKPLKGNEGLLSSTGVPADTAEAPQDEQLNIIADGKEVGTKFSFKAGESHTLALRVASEGKPGTGALYHAEQYEGNKLVGGVSHIVLY